MNNFIKMACFLLCVTVTCWMCLHADSIVRREDQQKLEWDALVDSIDQYSQTQQCRNYIADMLEPTSHQEYIAQRREMIHALVNDDAKREAIKSWLHKIDQDMASCIQTASYPPRYKVHRLPSYQRLPLKLGCGVYVLSTTGANMWALYTSYQGTNNAFQHDSFDTSLLFWDSVNMVSAVTAAVFQFQCVQSLYDAYATCRPLRNVFNAAKHIDDMCMQSLPSYDVVLRKAFTECTDYLDTELYNYMSERLSLCNPHRWVQAPSAEMLIYNNVEQIKRLIDFVGNVDAMIACADFVRARDMAYVEFVDNEKPYIKLDDFCAPIISSSDAVRNTLTMNGCNIFISGGNETGKTTTMKGVVQSIMLAQSIGYAPASQAYITPFSHIGTCFNAKENRFMAEKEQINTVHNDIHSVNGYKLFIIDEPIRSTCSDVAQELLYQFGAQLQEHDDVMVLMASHLAKPAHLADTYSKWSNYHMESVERDNRFDVTYKLKPGLDWWLNDLRKHSRFLYYCTFGIGNNDDENVGLYSQIIGKGSQPDDSSSIS